MDLMTQMALNDWQSLNKMLSSFCEDQVAAMLEHERGDKKRKDVLKRLHQRVSKLRSAREWAELEASL
jgi:hypothetical protein